jgi:hypothetical protein
MQEETKTMTLDEFQDDAVNGETLPANFELTKAQLECLKLEKFMKDYPDGKKPRYILVVGDKRYYTSQIVVSMLKKAKANPKLARIKISKTGTGLQTRYSPTEVESV